MSKKNVLGKGIGALLTDASAIGKPVQRPPIKTGIDLEIRKIQANPNQPRTKFDEEALQELASSIKQLGVIQPITVHQVGDDSFQIISGERRFRAAQIAGLSSIPAYIKQVEPIDIHTMALVENIQREDLDAIEIAISYQRLLDECELTQEQLSERVGKPRTTITNYLRLLKLPPEIQLGIINEDISMGHARALAGIDEADFQVQLFTRIIENDLSVREVEETIRKYKEGKTIDEIAKKKDGLQEIYELLRVELSERFKAKVAFSITPKGNGKISIPFSSEIDLERIIGILDKLKD